MDQDVKDILVDGDQLPDVDALTKATTALKAQLAAKDEEAKQLKAQYDRVARMADERGQEATRAQTELHGMAAYTSQAEHAAIANALARTEMEAKSLQGELASAIETADGKRASELQSRMADLASEKRELQRGKDRIEEEIARAKDAPAPQPRQSAALAADPYEALISQLPENQKQWLRTHKDKGLVDIATGKATSKLLKAYHAADDAGFKDGSPQFLVYMDRYLGFSKPPQAPPAPAPQTADASERFQEAPSQQAPAAQPAARKPIPAAPPSRAQGGASNSNGPRYALTREEKHTAARINMTDAEYVAMLQVGIQRGKYPHDYLSRRRAG